MNFKVRLYIFQRLLITLNKTNRVLSKKPANLWPGQSETKISYAKINF